MTGPSFLKGRVMAQLLRRPLVVAALGFLMVVVFIAVFASWVSPHDPNATDLSNVLRSPSGDHWIGTDQLGRDLLSRLIHGTRTSLLGAGEAVLISTSVGTVLGLLAGYLGAKVDTAISRVNDALMSVPGLILALAVVAVLGPGLSKAMFAIGVVFTPRCLRVVRAATLDLRGETFIEASIAAGCSPRRLLVTHVLPNIASPLLVVISVSLAAGVTAEAGLSYLGLGARPPASSWGLMLADASRRRDLGYLVWPPGIAITLTVAALTVVGDALQDAMSRRRKETRG